MNRGSLFYLEGEFLSINEIKFSSLKSFFTRYKTTVCVSSPQESINTGPFLMKSTCRRCGGRGSIISSPCALCRGTGQNKKRQTVAVPVPAGGFFHSRTCVVANGTTQSELKHVKKTEVFFSSMKTQSLSVTTACKADDFLFFPIFPKELTMVKQSGWQWEAEKSSSPSG